MKKENRIRKASQFLGRASRSLKMRGARLFINLKFRMTVFINRRPPPAVTTHGEETKAGSLHGRFCENPFKQIDLEESGAAYACCSSWLPTPIGNLGHKPLMELWNGAAIQRIRESIFDGSFRYCRHDRCPKIQNGELPTLTDSARDPLFTRIINEKQTVIDQLPVFLNLVNDRSCNLYCPSCRNKRINYQDGPKSREIGRVQDRLLEPYLSQPNDLNFILSVTGSGDPFASRVYRKLLYSLDGADFPNMKIALQTNGVLLTPRNWRRMQAVHRNIISVIISFDAATEETYQVTRRGGHWRTLLENSAHMGDLRKQGELKTLRFDFVVQKANFREMKDFVHLARSLGAGRASFSRLFNWGTWSRAQFRDQCVWQEEHPLFREFMDLMRDPLFDDPFVDMGNMTELRARALD